MAGLRFASGWRLDGELAFSLHHGRLFRRCKETIPFSVEPPILSADRGQTQEPDRHLLKEPPGNRPSPNPPSHDRRTDIKHPIALLLLVLTPFLFGVGAARAEGPGLISRDSPYPVPETLNRLEAVLKAKGITIFARIDHGGAAQQAGLTLRPSELLIFGNPKAGTPMMQAAPTLGLDLPMKVLAWQDEGGQVRITWNDGGHLAARHGLNADAAKGLSAVGGLVEAALK